LKSQGTFSLLHQKVMIRFLKFVNRKEAIMVSNLIELETFRCKKVFYDQVLPFFYEINPYFYHYKTESEAVFILESDCYLFTFLRYVPKNEETSLPTIQNCFNKIEFHPRPSHGEWVVSGVYEIKKKEAEELLKTCSEIQDSGEFQFLKRVIKR
jgi:hypothetical protein